jgi:hypothetical protein
MMGAEFPYLRDPRRCDICGRLCGQQNLTRVVVRHGRRGNKPGSPSKLARVVFVCPRHEIAPDYDAGRGSPA